MEKTERWLSLLLRTLLLGVFLWMIRGLLIPVALAGLFALLFHPLQRKLEAWLGKRASWAPLLLTTGSIVLIIIPTSLVAAKAISAIDDFLAGNWAEGIRQVQAYVTKGIESWTAELGFGAVRPDQISTTIENVVREAGSQVANIASGIALALPGQLLELFMFVLSLYFLLRDGAALSGWLRRLLPFSDVSTGKLFRSVRDTVNGAILGVFVTAGVQGVLTLIALYAFSVPGAFLLGMLATALAVIPMIGTTPVTVGAVIYLIAMDRYGAAAGMGVAAVVIGLSDNVIRPWVQSSQSHIHPLLALLSLFGGIEVFGAFGVFLGPVIAAMAVWAIDTYRALRLEHPEEHAAEASD